MKARGWPALLLIAAAAVNAAAAPLPDVAASMPAAAPTASAPARYSDPLAALADYRAGLDALLAVIPDATPETASAAQSLKRLVYPRLAWGRWEADGTLTAVTPGSAKGVWVMVLEAGHPQLATPGPTMTTKNLDIGVLVVQVRPDRITPRWAGLFLMHEMSHAHDELYAFDRPSCGWEYAAFGAEADALDRLTGGRFFPLLDRLIADEGLKTPAQYLAFVRDRTGMVEMLHRIDADLAEAPALSDAERQMRDGFYAVTVGERIGVRAGLDEDARCEAMAALIPTLSLY